MNEVTATEDNAFGPETDLILSLLVIVLLVGILAWFQGNRLLAAKEKTINEQKKTISEQIDTIKQGERKSVFQERASSFSQGSAAIGPEDERKLRLKVSEFEGDIQAARFAYLEVEGSASPEAWKGATAFDINLIKGYERAQAVAKILHSAGLPYECIKLSSFGRTSSDFLLGKIQAQPGRTPASIVGDFDKNPGEFASDRDLASERRTEIWGIPPKRNKGSTIPSVCMLLLKERPR